MSIEALAELDPERLRRLIEAGRTVVGQVRVEQVLDRLLETAREVTHARFVALGILDEERQALARFVTRGVSSETHRQIGELPRGRGVLGLLITEPHPLRLHDVASDPRAFGFPPGHPPMTTFLGVPVMIRGEAWGNLYLAQKEGDGDFDAADEASAVILADWAAIAIENARLYEAADRRAEDLGRAVRRFEATAAIATAVGAETELRRVLELVAVRARELLGVRSVLVLLREGDDFVLAASAGQVIHGPDRFPVAETRCGEVLGSRRPRRIDAVEDDPLLQSARLGVPDAATALLVPLTYRSRALGVLCAFDPLAEGKAFEEADEQVLMALGASAATGVVTAQSVEAERLRAALDSAEAERRRWARELHDETLQALGGLKVLLSSAVRSQDAGRLREAAVEAVEHVATEIENLRSLIAELRPASLDALGLGPALETLAQRLAAREGLDIRTSITLDGERIAPELETAMYRVAQEALTNVAKHARASRVRLALCRNGSGIVLEVDDDGVGFDPSEPPGGFGLVGMRERLELAGGTLRVEPREPTGTHVEAWFPA